jgi:hypothetical protein
MKKRTLTNTNPKQAKASGVESVGPMDTWKVVQKAWNKKEGWMKSTKALEIPSLGCLVQITTQQKDKLAEAVCFVPDVKLEASPDGSYALRHTGFAATQITFTSAATGSPVSESRTVWYGNAGEKLDKLLKDRDLLGQLNTFIQETWKITPNAKQLTALSKLIKGQ